MLTNEQTINVWASHRKQHKHHSKTSNRIICSDSGRLAGQTENMPQKLSS
uniref:Uncharacterized protein n=1 Tax=Arundo donax TaxID=35708 RepID=A0A0A9PYL3_ARUDO